MNCPSGKLAYATPQAAHNVCRRINTRGSDSRKRHALGYAPARLKAYKCRMCGNYHVGHALRERKA